MKIVDIPYTGDYKINLIGAVLLTVAIVIASTFSLYFLFGLILPIVVLSIRSGVQIDPLNNQYREYRKLFTSIKGEWKSLSNYKNIVIKSQSAIKSTSGTLMTADLKQKKILHSIYLMDENHLKQMFLKTFEDYDKAKIYADNLSRNLNLTIKIFRPFTKRP